MIKMLLLGSVLLAPVSALACGGDDDGQTEASIDLHATPSATKDPSACAHKAGLVGHNCSYTTGMMAQRVLAEGSNWSFTGTLASSDNALPSKVAAPFTVGPAAKVNVIANQTLEDLSDKGLDAQRVTLDGKRLEVDGITYFVLTSYSAPNS